jgi:sodium pump decarboxylase gamma subunit
MKKKIALCAPLMLANLMLTGCDSDIGSKMSKAAMNTLLGMGTVFIVLIFIAFIISRFKYISRFEMWLNNRGQKEEKMQQTNSLPVEEETETETEAAVDDLELVAVITAALAAALDTSTDKLIVRSIRRKNSNRW